MEVFTVGQRVAIDPDPKVYGPPDPEDKQGTVIKVYPGGNLYRVQFDKPYPSTVPGLDIAQLSYYGRELAPLA